MNDKKTIGYLNSKWWYRLLKILTIFLFIISVIALTLLIYSEEKPNKIIDNEKTTVSCYGKIFNAKELNLIYYEDINENFIYWAKIHCKQLEFQKNPDKYPVSEAEIEIAQGRWSTFNKLFEQPEHRVPDDKNFKIEDHYKMTDTYIKVVAYIIIWWLIFYIIFEILRRSFYYILLGTIKPKK